MKLKLLSKIYVGVVALLLLPFSLGLEDLTLDLTDGIDHVYCGIHQGWDALIVKEMPSGLVPFFLVYYPSDEFEISANGKNGDDILDFSNCPTNWVIHAEGGLGDDEIYATTGVIDDILDGGPGNDIIAGYAGDDEIYGGDGQDDILGGYGDDLIFGEDDNDNIYGGSGHDEIYGDFATGETATDGNDEIHGDDGLDYISGGDGTDHIYGGPEDDEIDGGSMQDFIYGGEGKDILRGQDGNDEIHGDGDDDKVYGGDGYDYLYGGPDDDLLCGGDGNDYIYGEGGYDEAGGEGGDDTIAMGGHFYDRAEGHHHDTGDSVSGCSVAANCVDDYLPSNHICYSGTGYHPEDPVNGLFLRGNANNDNSVNISDGIYVINWYSLGGPAPFCDDAADANDDGTVDLADATYILTYYSQGGTPPPAPFPTAGMDTTVDSLTCSGPGLS